MRGVGKNRKTDRFIEQALTMETDDCILWPYATLNHGHACVGRDYQTTVVTRIICERAYGPPPSAKHEAAHECKNPPCINKRHLRWDTHQANMIDRIRDGTSMRGRNTPLTEVQVRDIRNRAASGELQKEIAARYGVIQQTVSSIIRGKNWSWLT